MMWMNVLKCLFIRSLKLRDFIFKNIMLFNETAES